MAGDEVENFADFLRQQGLKLTQQREGILRRVLQIKKHFSAEQLFEALRDEDSGISKATVYRTLTLLVESGLLAEHDFERGHKLYERASHQCHHDHLICVDCGRIVEFHNEQIEQLQEEIAGRFEFRMVSHTHQIFGQCPTCQSKGSRRGR